MNKYWKTTAIKDGKPITLYVTTNEKNIAADLAAAGSGGSLIIEARGRRGILPAGTDDLDLAAGAFSYHITRQGYGQTEPAIESVDDIPEGLTYFDFDENPASAIRLYEEPADTQPSEALPNG